MKISLSFLLFLFFISTTLPTYARLITPNNISNSEHKKIEGILTKKIYDELYKRTKGLKPEVEVKKAKISINDGRRGKMIIEMLKQKNREKIARMRGLDPSKATSGKAIVEQQQDRNRELVKKMIEEEKRLEKKYGHLPLKQRKEMIWKVQAKQEMKELEKKVSKNKGWEKKHKRTLKQWEKDYKKYVGKIEDYKEGLTKIPTVLPISKEEASKPIEVKIPEEYFIIPGSLDLNIRDQGRRPTCSSFAGIRAIEVLLNQNNEGLDLSEQYFYWSSKPKCRQSPCSERGSWVGYGLDFSKGSIKKNIPLEKNCPYKDTNISRNDTQVPLKEDCRKGRAKVKRFQYHKSVSEILNSLRENKPVIAGLKLSPNFYQTRGLVLQQDVKGKASGMHSSGHAILFVGYMKLPKVLNEGKVCFITANSWGVGWGHGGYACLSEEWVIKNRQSNPFVSIDAIEI